MVISRRIPSTLAAACMSVLLACAAVLGMPRVAFAVEGEVNQSTYDALGLPTDPNAGSELTAPYASGAALFERSEVYVAANGDKANRYTLRDGFDLLGIVGGSKDMSIGDYDFYSVSNGDYDVHGSYLSTNGTNTKNKISNNDNEFSGIYATSIAFDAGVERSDGSGITQDNYIAELRAYGNDARTSYNGRSYKGQICLKVFSVDSSGTRREVASLTPSINDSLFYPGSDGVFSYFTRKYVQELDALFEVRAGDVDGDGKDEIFTYCGAYEDRDGRRRAIVDMFKQNANGSYDRKSTSIDAGPVGSYESGGDWTQRIEYHPVVTMACGNLDREGGDELAVTVSAPTDNSDVQNVGRCSIYTWDGNELAIAADNLGNISLAKGGSDGRAMVSANCVFGNFAQMSSKKNLTALVIAGYETNGPTSGGSTGTYWNAGVRYVYLDPDSGDYVVSDYQTRALGTDGGRIADSYSTDDGHYRPVHAPLALACADLQGFSNVDGNGDSSDALSNDDVLLGGDVYKFQIDGGFGSSVGSMNLSSAQENQDGHKKDKEQVWIGDVAAGCVSSVPGDETWRESFVAVIGVHRNEEVNGRDDYYWMDLGQFSLKNGDYDYPATAQEGVICESNRRNDQFGTFVSLSLPDIDEDSIFAKYVSQATLYTNPVVYAVLEDAPCYGDLQSVYNYIKLGGTGFKQSNSTETGSGTALSFEAGVYSSAKVEGIAAAEFESEVKSTGSYDYNKSTEVTYSQEFESHAGTGNKVVVYTVPMVYYRYQVLDPATKTWQDTVFSAVLSPEMAVLGTAEYDEVAKGTDGLEPVSSLLSNTSGDPSTYLNAPNWDKLLYTFDKSGYGKPTSSGSEGVTVTEEIEVKDTMENTSEFGLAINAKAGGGAGALGTESLVGIVCGSEAGFHNTKVTTEGQSFSGAVDNLPEEASNYGFSWNLEVGKKALSKGSGSKGNPDEKQDVPAIVVGYSVKVTKAPEVGMVSGFRATGVSSDSASLAWNRSSDPGVKYVLSMMTPYGLNDFITLDNDVTTFTVGPDTIEQGGLSANRSYEFYIRGVKVNEATGRTDYGLKSRAVELTTPQEGEGLVITQDPEDQMVLAGGRASFAARGEYVAPDGTRSDAVSYRWFSEAPGTSQWVPVDGQAGIQAVGGNLVVTGATSELDGTRYRCVVMHLDSAIASDEAVLSVTSAAEGLDLSGRKTARLAAAVGSLRRVFGDVIVPDPGSSDTTGEGGTGDASSAGAATEAAAVIPRVTEGGTPQTGDGLPAPLVGAFATAAGMALILAGRRVRRMR